MVLLGLKAIGRPPRAAAGARRRGAGYRDVLGDRVFLRVWALMALLVTVGYAQFNAASPAYALGHGLSAGALGIVFAANTLAVVGVQLVVLRVTGGRRRSSAIAVLCSLWGASWALALVAGGLGGQRLFAGLTAACALAAVGAWRLERHLPATVNLVGATPRRSATRRRRSARDRAAEALA